MFNVSCVWWICHIHSWENRPQNQQLDEGLLFETTRSICAGLHKGWTSHIWERGSCLFYVWLSTWALLVPLAFQKDLTPLLRCLLRCLNRWEVSKYKCMRMGFHPLFNIPNISLADCLVWCAIATELSSKWDKSTLCRWKVNSTSVQSVKSFQPCDFTTGGLALIVFYILTFWPLN